MRYHISLILLTLCCWLHAETNQAPVQKPRLGIYILNIAPADGGGAVIVRIVPGSLAETIGLKAGYVIRGFECGETHTTVNDKLELIAAIQQAPIDKEFFIDVFDGSNEKKEFRGTFQTQVQDEENDTKEEQAQQQNTDAEQNYFATVTSFRAGEPNVIMIDAGSEAGLKKDERIYIKRGDTLICQARLVKVGANKAMAHNEQDDWDEATAIRELQAGDGVDLEP